MPGDVRSDGGGPGWVSSLRVRRRRAEGYTWSDGVTANPDDRWFADLMCAAQRGDGTAYTSLLRELVPLLRRVVTRRAGLDNEADIEDVVQDILLSVHTVRATFDPTRPFLPWLLAIARNRIVDAARRHGRARAREVSLEELTVTSGADPTNTSFDGGDTEALTKAIEELPPGQRQAISLLKLHGLSLREAAAATGMTEGALKVATHRAMAALRRKLAGE